MSDLTKNEIIHIAKLANLKVTDKEIEKFQKQLSSVIKYVSELEEVDTENTKPTSQTTGLENIKREDTLQENDSLSLEETLSGTENTHNGYFKVSAILEE